MFFLIDNLLCVIHKRLSIFYVLFVLKYPFAKYYYITLPFNT